MMNIAVIPNVKKDRGLKYTEKLIQELKGQPCRLYLSEEFCRSLPGGEDGISFVPEDTLYLQADMIIVLGGDGSILKVAQKAMYQKTPILGINLGKVGYLADVELSETDLLAHLFMGEYQIETRTMLDCTLLRSDGRKAAFCTALNDIVIANGSLSKMIATELSCNGKKLGVYYSDGIIFSTPTGSTAYSLSAGGPVVDPSLDSIIVTPICAHSLTARPLVFSSESMIEVANITEDDRLIYLTADGDKNIQIQNGDRVMIQKSEFDTKLIRLKDESFLNVLNKKMKERL